MTAVLTLLRLLWVAVRPAAPQFPTPGWMHAAARLVHVAMWVLLLALPVTALLALGSERHPLTLLGGFRVDHMPLIAAFASLAYWGDVYEFLGDAIMWLAGVHATAAIAHHKLLKVGVLASMLPPLKRG